MTSYRIPPGKDLARLLAEGQGLKGENFPRHLASGGQLSVSQTAYFQLMPFRAGDLVTNIHVMIITTGSSSTTKCKVALFNTAGTQLAVSADLGTSWETTGLKTHALGTPYSVPTDGVIYVAIHHVASTAATILRATAVAGVHTAVGSGAFILGAQTGQADMPSPATIANASQFGFWMGWS